MVFTSFCVIANKATEPAVNLFFLLVIDNLYNKIGGYISDF